MATIACPQYRVSSTASSPSLANKRPSRQAVSAPACRAPDRRHSPAVSASPAPPSVYPSFLQPRVAVVLKVPQPWHPWLFALRLCSILPALWWGLPSALQLVLRLLPGIGRVLVVRSGWTESPSLLCDPHHARHADAAIPYALTEGALATIWVNACMCRARHGFPPRPAVTPGRPRALR